MRTDEKGDRSRLHKLLRGVEPSRLSEGLRMRRYGCDQFVDLSIDTGEEVFGGHAGNDEVPLEAEPPHLIPPTAQWNDTYAWPPSRSAVRQRALGRRGFMWGQDGLHQNVPMPAGLDGNLDPIVTGPPTSVLKAVAGAVVEVKTRSESR